MRRLSQVACLAASLAFATPARALTARSVSVVELTRASDDVIVGTVRRSVSRWEGRFIVTDHEVEVVSALKGRLPERATVVVRVAGGVVGRIGQQIPGAATLDDGATYLLFLEGGVSTVRYLAHVSAAAVPVTLDAMGHVQARVPSSLVMTGATGVVDAHTAASTTALERLTTAVRAVRP